MSAQWMGFYFYNRDTRLEGSLLLTLLAIADHADSSGAAWPRRDLIADKARISVRQVRRNFRTLEDLGYLETKQGQGRGKQSFYQLLRPEPPSGKGDNGDTFSEPKTEPEIKGDTDDPFSVEIKGDTDVRFSEIKGDTGDQEKGTPMSEKGDTHVRHIYNHQEPSLEPPNKQAVRSDTKTDIASNFGPPQNLGRKIGDYHFLDFRELLDRAAPHLAGEHLADVRKMWMSGVAPLEVIKCYNTMRMEAWRTHAVTWKTVAGYLPDWK